MNAKQFRIVAMLAVLPALGEAQTINWGSEVWSNLIDSNGDPLYSSSYVFELGAFETTFTPLESNVTSWADNWHPFDRTIYDEGSSYFTSFAYMNPADGTSDNPIAGSTDFSDLPAYLWVRNTLGEDAAFLPSGEYLLTRDARWIFPPLVEDPPADVPLQWSVGDFLKDGSTTGVTVLKTGTTGNSGLIYEPESIFEWALNGNTNSPGDRGTGYSGVDVVGNLDIDPDAVFKVILHDGVSFTEPFWQSQQTWNNIFNATGTTTAGWTPSQTVMVYDAYGDPVDVSPYGNFSLNGTTLTWNAVPEPASTVFGLLLVAGLLRRHRTASQSS